MKFDASFTSDSSIHLDRNIDVSPSKSFQGHTGPIHDLCQISIGKFHLLLTASSDLTVRVSEFEDELSDDLSSR